MGSERKAMNREKGKSSFIWKVSRSLETHEVGGPGDAVEESGRGRILQAAAWKARAG